MIHLGRFCFILHCMWKKGLLKFLLAVFSFANFGYSQDSINAPSSVGVNYFEDQFYAGLAYNFLTNRPENVVLRNFSYGLQAGFIKDIPLSKKRNFGLGIGLGYAANSYYTNIIAEELTADISYRLSEDSDGLNRSKFETHGIEFPFEIRWRTSNATEYKFWRVYGGFKAAYLFSRQSKKVTDEEKINFTNTDIAQWQYGLTLNFGYNTWNIHLYYSLNPLLEADAQLNNLPIEMNPLRIGVIFYIL